MKFIKKYLIFIILIFLGFMTPFFFHAKFHQNFDIHQTDLVLAAQLQMKKTVTGLVAEINELRKSYDDTTVKNIIYTQINNESLYLSPSIHITELLKHVDEVTETHSDNENNGTYYAYSIAYKDFNWIITCKISESSLFNSYKKVYFGEKQILIFSDISITLIVLLGFLAIFYVQKTNTKANLIKLSTAKSEAKSEFLSVLSHELRTPLNAIIGLNDLLKENIGKPEIVTDFSNKIDESSQILLSLINDVLDMSAIEKGLFKLENRQFDIRELTNSITEMYKPLTEKKGLKYICDTENIQHSLLIGDSYRIRQILLNLLSNSFKFTKKGMLQLKIREEVLSDLKSLLVITVRDTGCGMNPDFLQHLYTEFSQADTSIARQYGGSGLGLSITKKIIDLMNGTISVESKVDRGTTFTVKLPLEIYSNQQENMPNTISQNFVFDEKKLKGLTILSVEDNNINQMIIVNILKKYKLNVTTASNGQEAVDIMKKTNDIQLILMDIRMPIMDGLTATKCIREFNTIVPIIALSANAFIEDTKKSYAAGMNYHLSKPIDTKKLLYTIETYINSL